MTSKQPCWECTHASGKNACEWAKDNTPIKGWVATPTKLRNGQYTTDSYSIGSCPKFKKGHLPTKADNDEYRLLLCQVLAQAVADWKALDYGRATLIRTGRENVYTTELIAFFESDYCDEIARTVLNRSGAEVCEALGVHETELPKPGKVKFSERDKEAIRLLYENDGNVIKAACAGYFSPATIYARTNSIKRRTHINPLSGWGLSILIKWVKEMENNEQSGND